MGITTKYEELSINMGEYRESDMVFLSDVRSARVAAGLDR